MRRLARADRERLPAVRPRTPSWSGRPRVRAGARLVSWSAVHPRQDGPQSAVACPWSNWPKVRGSQLGCGSAGPGRAGPACHAGQPVFGPSSSAPRRGLPTPFFRPAGPARTDLAAPACPGQCGRPGPLVAACLARKRASAIALTSAKYEPGDGDSRPAWALVVSPRRSTPTIAGAGWFSTRNHRPRSQP